MNKILYVVVGVLLTVAIYLWSDILQFKITIDKRGETIQTYSNLFDKYKKDSLNVNERNERLQEEVNNTKHKLLSRNVNCGNERPLSLVCLASPMEQLVIEYIDKFKNTRQDSLTNFIVIEILDGYSNADGLVYKLIISCLNLSEIVAMNPIMFCTPIEDKNIILVDRTLDAIASVNTNSLHCFYKTYFSNELNEMSNVQRNNLSVTFCTSMEVLYNVGLGRVENKFYF